ncbi:putative glycoside hydrolase [Paenibacillus ferrarius]|uniref:putative glycoside hydrolase n=1 Tax=Paenibacillus ferrarius TaxID=1469647 RepID=UPI003D2CCBAD
MDILLASLALILGNVNATHPDANFDQLVQASLQADKATVIVQPATPGPNADPLDPVNKQDPQKDAPVVKGIYATAHSAGGSRLTTLVKLLDDTDLNSMVIDVKDDWGYITWETGNPELDAMGTTQKIIGNMPGLMSTLNEHQIYPIARIVVFKDTVLAKAKPEWSFVNPDGTLWNNGKDSFVNPYNKDVWDYNIAVAKEAVKAGFKEIQFDYVRFPEGFEKRADILKYTKDERTRIQAVAAFVKYAKEQLQPLGVRVSVDIFGYAASVPAAEGIGQDFEKISQNVDVIAPMIYPSHYSTGWFGSKVPDAAPYQTINGASKDIEKKLTTIDAKGWKPVVRPWIQDFTASWVPGYIKYDKHEIEEQVRALKENGINEFLLWNANNNYTPNVNY